MSDSFEAALNMPDITVNVQKSADYTVNVQRANSTVHRTGSLLSVAEVALTASYALVADTLHISGNLQYDTISASNGVFGIVSASNLTGQANYLPVWSTPTTLSPSMVYQTTNFVGNNLVIGNTGSNYGYEIVTIDGGEDISWDPLYITGKSSYYLELQVKNEGGGVSSSSDIVATSDGGGDYAGFIDMGINSSTYAYPGFGGPMDAYLYTTGSNLLIGNATPDKKIIIFNGGYDISYNARLYIDSIGTVGINTDLPTAGAPEALVVRGLTDSFNMISAFANLDNYAQINIKNIAGNQSSSSDIVATANYGTEEFGYIDMGINADQYVAQPEFTGGPGDAYLVALPYNDLYIGNATPFKDTILFAGGQALNNTNQNIKLKLKSIGSHEMSGSLSVSEYFIGDGRYLTNLALALPAGVISSSGQVDYNFITNKLSGVISSSTQTKALLPTGTVSSSAQFRTLTSPFTGSYTGSFTGDGTNIINVTATAIPAGPNFSVQFKHFGAVSGSQNLTFNDDLNILSLTGSFGATSITGSLLGTASNAFLATSASFAINATIPSGTVSSSLQFNSFTLPFTGSFTGSLNGSGSIITTGTLVQLLSLGGVTHSAQDMQNFFHSSGWVIGGEITTGSGLLINVNSGSGTLRNASISTSPLYAITWTTSSGTVASGSTKYIGVEWNNGSPRVTYRDTRNWDYLIDWPLGLAVREPNGELYIFNDVQRVGDHASQMIRREFETMPLARDERNGGLDLSELSGRHILVSAGAIWDRLNRYPINQIDTSGTDAFDSYYSSGSTFINIEDNTVWDNVHYDDGSGVLAGLTTDYYGLLWFYIDGANNLSCVYGTANHATTLEVEAEPQPVTLPQHILLQSRLIGRLIFQSGSSSAYSITSAFTSTFSSAPVTNWNLITGIPSGLVSSSRQFNAFSLPFTGSYTGSFKGDGTGITGVVANAPAGTVSSSTQVKNLLPLSTVSSSGQVDYNSITNKLSGVYSSSTQLPAGLISSSAQLPAGTVSSSGQYAGWVTSSTQIDYNSIQNKLSGTWSSSAQLPAGILSSSTQFKTLTDPFTGSFSGSFKGNGSNLISVPMAAGTVSSSGQYAGWVTSSTQIDYNSITNKLSGVYSSSAQLPANLISASSQFKTLTDPFTGSFTGSFKGDGTNLINVPMTAGTVSSSAQYPGWVTASSQIDYNSITNKLSGVWSSSAQLPAGTVSSSLQFNSLTSPFTGSYTGSFKGDGTNLTGVTATVPAGTISSSTQFKTLTDPFTGSFTGSFKGNGANLTGVVSTVPAGTVSSSAQYPGWVTASSQIDYNSITNKLSGVYSSSAQLPAGTVSSSLQFNTFTTPFTGSYTGSFKGDGTNLTGITATVPAGTVSSSAQYAGWVTSSTQIDYNSIQNKLSGVYSSSAQLPANLISSSTQFKTLTDPFTGSFTGSYAGTFPYASLTSIPAGIVSSSAQYAGWVTSSTQIDYNSIQNKLSGVYSSSAQLPAGLVSASSQFKTLTDPFTGSFTGSHAGTFPYASLTSIPAGIISSSAQLPAGTVSSSAQYAGWVTSSTQIDYNSIQNKLSGVYSSSAQLPAGLVSSSTQASSWTVATASYASQTASFAITASYASNAGTSGLKTKVGMLSASQFTGNPKKSTVTFISSFASPSYSIVITGEDLRTFTVESRVAGSFIINTNSNTALVGNTYWNATAFGET